MVFVFKKEKKQQKNTVASAISYGKNTEITIIHLYPVYPSRLDMRHISGTHAPLPLF